MNRVKFSRLRENAMIPERASPGASGFDLVWAPEPGITMSTLLPREWRLFETGIAVEIPVGMEIQIRPRSGLARDYGITVLNSPGTIDSDYRGEVGVILINHSRAEWVFCPGDKIAQAVVCYVDVILWEEVDELSPTARGSGGYGSTGR